MLDDLESAEPQKGDDAHAKPDHKGFDPADRILGTEEKSRAIHKEDDQVCNESGQHGEFKGLPDSVVEVERFLFFALVDEVYSLWVTSGHEGENQEAADECKYEPKEEEHGIVGQIRG